MIAENSNSFGDVSVKNLITEIAQAAPQQWMPTLERWRVAEALPLALPLRAQTLEKLSSPSSSSNSALLHLQSEIDSDFSSLPIDPEGQQALLSF
jgi:hypothetical protein